MRNPSPFSNVLSLSPKERFFLVVFLVFSVFSWSAARSSLCPGLLVVNPIRPAGVSSIPVRHRLEQRLLIVADLPLDLGSLEPKGRTNPDGSEVWGFPEGSDLEEVIEVHVKDGRVVREVLRPSSRISTKALAGSP